MNALLRQNRTGCRWRLPPHDSPAWPAVPHYLTPWRRGGLGQRIQEILRCQARERSGRSEDPSPVIIDTRSVRAAAGVPRRRRDWTRARRRPAGSGDSPSTCWA
ncbi:hypothetical protein ACIBAI_21710 [Streptomyces sp. NPDC051041]|uniref:hypothetical protein n=1 Tax=Streptomyces sp. NPDC051041 TaxID=3365640 RepID=UPI00379DF52A